MCSTAEYVYMYMYIHMYTGCKKFSYPTRGLILMDTVK